MAGTHNCFSIRSVTLIWAWENSGMLFRRSTDHGATFSAPTTPPDGSLAVDSKGDIFDLWGQSGALLLSRSTDGGATFTQINNLGNVNGGPLALDSHDNIDIPANVTKSVGDFQIVFFRSTDGGRTFSGPTQISNDTKMQCPELTGMALENTGNIDVVWEQFASPYGATGVAGCDSLPNQVLFSRGVVPGFSISAAPGRRPCCRAVPRALPLR